MKIIYHLQEAIKELKIEDYSKEDLSNILLDLYWIDNKQMGRRCRVEIYDQDEKIKKLNTFCKYGHVKIEKYFRTVYLKPGITSVCVYKKGENEDYINSNLTPEIKEDTKEQLNINDNGNVQIIEDKIIGTASDILGAK